MMPAGFCGSILHVDLTSGGIEAEKPDEMFYRRYGGGGAMAACYALRSVAPKAPPLHPGSPLLIMAGLLAGLPVPALARFTVAGPSPLTGGYGEAEAGGFFGPELRFAGYDGLVITGRAAMPVYLAIRDGAAELRDARAMWGKTTGETEDLIRRDLGDERVRVAAIGPAGERGTRFACVIADLRHAAGRTGMGALMGSKNLKAVAVRGSGRLEVADAGGVAAVARWYVRECRDNPSFKSLAELGTAGGVAGYSARGILPTRNFRSGSFAGAAGISGEKMRDEFLVGRSSCFSCPGQCKRVVRSDGPPAVDPRYGGPEYETVAAFGSLCEVGDMRVVARANQLCNMYGLDTISTGVCAAFAMECRERGIAAPGELVDAWPQFGDGAALLRLIEDIALRRGVGNLLAEGVRRAAAAIGGAAPGIAMHVKGQELPMHEPRGKSSVGLGYAVSPTGADHLEAEHDTNFDAAGLALHTVAPLGILEPVDRHTLDLAKVRNFCYLQMLWNLYNTLGVCLFGATPGATLSLARLVELVRAATGWDTSLFELMKLGERGISLMRAYNIRQGLGRADDTLPDRLFGALEGGALAGRALSRTEFDGALEAYYVMMGWDRKTGVPTREKLSELDVAWVADLLQT